MTDEPQLRIVAVAIRERGSKAVFSMRRPHRHGNLYKLLRDTYQSEVPATEQGFLDSNGCFRCRAQAFFIARDAGQLQPEAAKEGRELFSEDLW